MSKRHHVQRRKAYGRRQHALRERGGRRPLSELVARWDDAADEPTSIDPIAFVPPRGARIRFAVGD
jgi:hypothetical protein